MAPPEVVLYAPDKGVGYGQAFRVRGIMRAWEALNDFLRSTTLCSDPLDACLVAYRATRWDDDSVADACIRRTIGHFGPPDRVDTIGGVHWPSGEPLKGGELAWDVTPEQLPSVVRFLADGEPWPRQTLGPLALHYAVSFLWRDPETGEELAGQRDRHASPGGHLISTILVTLSRRSMVQPELWFPYPEGSPRLTAMLAYLAPRLPFTLLPRHFRCATPRRDGMGYTRRKMVLPPVTAD